MLQDFIFIGKILKSSGKKGKFKIYPLTDFPERFKLLEYVYIYDEKNKKFINEGTEKKKFIIKGTSYSGKYIYISFENFEEENDFINECFLCIEESKRIKLSEGQYYFYDLLNCKVQSESQVIGYVNAIENYGGDDLLSVLSENDKKILIPMREEFIENVDIKNKVIVIKYIEGLTD